MTEYEQKQLIGNLIRDQEEGMPIIGNQMEGVRNGTGIEVAIVQITNGESPLPPTNLSSDEIYLVLSGNARIEVSGENVQLPEGNFIVSTSGSPVNWKNSEPLQILAVKFHRPETEVLPAHPYIIHNAVEYASQNRDYIVGGFPDDPIANTLGVGIALKTLRPGASENSHYHTGSTELCVVTKGSWPIEANGKGTTLNAGDYVLSQPGSFLAWIIPETSEPVDVLVIRFPIVGNDTVVGEVPTPM